MKYIIWKINRKYGPFDILYGNNIEANVGVAFSGIKAKKWAHLRDTIIFEDIETKSQLQKTIHKKTVKFIETKLHKKIDLFIAISEFMRHKCSNILKIDPQKIAVTYNGVSDNQATALPFDASRCRRFFVWPAENPCACCIL